MQKNAKKLRLQKNTPKNTQKIDLETRFGLPNPSKTPPKSKKNRIKNDVQKRYRKNSKKIDFGLSKKTCLSK